MKSVKTLLLILILIISGCTWSEILLNEQNRIRPVDVPESAAIGKEPPPEPITTPGEYKLDAPKAKSFFLVYVPYDYTADQAFPVIFCYHGAGGSATTWPFFQITHGQGFIVVGMSYTPSAYTGIGLRSIKEEKAFFFEAYSIISARLKINPQKVFMGGYSQGGYHTTLLGEQLIDRLAGFIILGAGRYAVDRYPPPMRSIRGKPIFIGVGENDTVHNPRARSAANLYQGWGADVTFEEWPGVAHGITTPEFPSKKLLNWLQNKAKDKK